MNAAKYHISCTTLLLSDYIRCQIDNDLTVLIIEGAPEPNELKAAWASITQEFFDLSQDKQANYELTLCAQMEALNYKIIVVQNAVEVLEKYRCDELVEILQKYGYRFPFDISNEDKYLGDLKKVISRAKSLVVEYNDKAAQLEKISKAKGPEQAVTRQYYDKILSVLSKFMNHQVDETKITVSRYAAILNMYIAHCEQLNARNNG